MYFGALSHGKASTICSAVPCAVGLAATLKWTPRAPMMRQYDQNEEHLEADGGHGKEVDGRKVCEMGVQGRSPGRRGGLRSQTRSSPRSISLLQRRAFAARPGCAVSQDWPKKGF